MKEFKLLGLMAIATGFAFVALYWELGSNWNELIALAAGLLYGFAVGVYYGIEKMYQHVQGKKPDSDTTQDILGRIL